MEIKLQSRLQQTKLLHNHINFDYSTESYEYSREIES